MKAISLFSGVGGFDLGFERAGIETVLQAEKDPQCLKVLERHWPHVRRVTDVRCVGVGPGQCDQQGEPNNPAPGESDTARAGDVDLIYGGFPCQDLSVAGKRAGLGGERSGLWYEFHRVLSELRPRWTVIENVPGLLSSNGGRDFGIILHGLGELGFHVGWAVLDAQHFGVPQRRRRVFIVGGPRRRSVEQVLSLCESCGGNPETGRTQGQGTPGSVAIRTANTGANGHGIADDVAHTLDGANGQAVLANPLGASRRGIRLDLDHDTYIPDVVGALSDGAHHGGGLNGQDAYTGRVIATSGVRRLTPLECERLQGFPDGRTEGQADSHRYRQMGNAVCVPVAEWLGHRIAAIEKARVSTGLEGVRE